MKQYRVCGSKISQDTVKACIFIFRDVEPRGFSLWDESHSTIAEQLTEAAEWADHNPDYQYTTRDFGALANRFIDYCMDPESDIAGHFHNVYEDEGQGGTDDIEVYSVISPLNSEFAYRPKHFKDGQEGQDVEFWFKMSKKYRTCTALFGLRYQGQAIHDWVTQHEDEVRD